MVSFGNLVMLSQYVQWQGSRPLARSRRPCRSSGPCSTPARSTTRASSLHGPVHRGPAGPGAGAAQARGHGRAAQLRAGQEIADGIPRPRLLQENYEYVVDHVRKGPSGPAATSRTWPGRVEHQRGRQRPSWPRTPPASSSPSTSPRCCSRRWSARHRVRQPQPIFDAFASGVAKAIELTTPELVDKLSVAGTPDEVVHKLKTDILSTASTT